MNLTFDPVAHIYRLDGVVVPNVTGILRDEGFVDASWFTPYAAERGTKGHRAIQLYDEGDLAEGKLDPVLRPYLEAWKRFRADTGVVIQASEVKMVSETYRFAGTVDKLALLKDVPIVLDLKTGVISPWVAIQVAAYHILVNESQRKRYAVQLNNDGSYRLQEFKDRSDRQVFLAALSCWKWKQVNGGKNNG